MADPLDQALRRALSTLARRIRADPAIVPRRRARRRLVTLQRPPRACCLVVRASDRRINERAVPCVPDDYADLASEWHEGRMVAHEVTLTAPALRHLCAPVTLHPMGEDWQDAARKLGVRDETLRYAMTRGVFHVHRVPRLAGKRGKPVPVLFCDHPLDPGSSNLRLPPDPLFAPLWRHTIDRLAHDFEQTLVRLPQFRPYPNSAPRFRGYRWECPGCRRRVRALFLPLPPMNVLDFLGRSALSRVLHPFVSTADDDDPLAGRLTADGRLGLPADTDDVPRPVPTFACHHCHTVAYFDRINPNAWNHLIAFLTAGVLFGSEVRRPLQWTQPVLPHAATPSRRFLGRPWTHEQIAHWHPPTPPRKTARRPAPRRDAVERLLRATTWTHAQIAHHLGLTPRSVATHAAAVYRRHGVHRRGDLT